MRATKIYQKIYLEVEVEVVKSKRDKFPGTADGASVINNLLFSLFRSCYVKLNNIDVVSIDSNLALKDFIETNLNFSLSTATRRLISQGFIPGGTQTEIKKLIEKAEDFVCTGSLTF